jgi:hypothetical protein
MPFTKAVDVVRRVPPVDASYHFIVVPVTLKLAIVGDTPEQNVWDEAPVGADGVVLGAAVPDPAGLVHPFTV